MLVALSAVGEGCGFVVDLMVYEEEVELAEFVWTVTFPAISW